MDTETGTVPIIHECDTFVVINKPSGLLSVPGRGPDKQDCVAARVSNMFPSATGPLTVHRLDMETSGLMVFALDPETHRALSQQFMDRKTDKRYTAMLEGHVQEESGQIDLPLVADWPNRPRQKVCDVDGKPSCSHWRTLERTTLNTIPATRVEFRPVTGRSHQLRVHAATPRVRGGLGHAILGDVLYGDPSTAPRLMLHAHALSLEDPASGIWMKFVSEPDW